MSSNLDRRAENLSFAFQEILTIGERLRANRQPVSDTDSFRYQAREALKLAETEARKRGYGSEDIQLAIFAVVAFLDESILNLRNTVFADWVRRPLQEEMFGHHVAGEIFFQNLQRIMSRDESQETADLLEVYQLCLLLGFAGRYSLGGRGDLQSIQRTVGEKIARIRQLPPDLSPLWKLGTEAVQSAGRDPWVRRLSYVALVCLAITIMLFAVYKMKLGNTAGALRQITAQGRS